MTATAGLLLACLAVAAPVGGAVRQAVTGAGRWTSDGPYGGALVFDLAVDPTRPSVVYAAVPSRGLFKSTDAGGSWFELHFPMPSPFSIAIDPLAPDTLYAGVGSASIAGAYNGGVFKSKDGGATWTATDTGLPESPQVNAVVIDPTNPATLYAAVFSMAPDRGVFKSTNAGASWTLTGLRNVSVLSLAVDPLAPSTLYAGTAGSGALYKSTDAGESWRPANAGLQYETILDVAVDPTEPRRLYAVGGDIYRSDDGGTSWAPANAGVGGIAVRVDPRAHSTVYVAACCNGPGVFKSTNFGATWLPMSKGLRYRDSQALALDPQNPNTLYVAPLTADPTGDGVFKSTDAGQSWAEANTGLTGMPVRALVADPVSDVAYAATDHGLFKSTGSGAWVEAGHGLPSPYVGPLAVAAGTPATLYAATSGQVSVTGLFRSTDAGSTWTQTSLRVTSPIGALTVDPTTPATLYAATVVEGLSKSTDGGLTWNSANTGLEFLDVRSLAIDLSTPSTAYAGTGNGGVYKTTDGGASWLPATVGMGSASIGALVVDPSASATIYAGGFLGVFKSTDAGATWHLTNTGLPSPQVSTLALVPGDPLTLYAGTDLGFSVSTNGGVTWASASAGLPSWPLVFAAAAGPAGTSSVYVGLRAGSVWQASPPPPAFVKGDINGDGLPDLVFRSAVDGRVNKVWFMDGVAQLSEAPVVPDADSAAWSLRGVDDFDGDGDNDLVFWNQATGQVEFWLMDGATRTGAPVPLSGGPALGPSWDLSATADFNHDGRTDIVWRNLLSQKIVVWTLVGTTKASAVIPVPSQATDANWTIVSALDFSGDGDPDFLWYNQTSGKLVTWYMDDAVARISGQFTNPSAAGSQNWKALAAADFSHDHVPGTPPLGSPDVVWRNASSGKQVVWHMDFASTRVAGEFTQPAANTPALDWMIVGPR